MAHQSSKLKASVTSFSASIPEVVDIRDPEPDQTPSDSQPPGVDDDDFPQSLEEALMG